MPHVLYYTKMNVHPSQLPPIRTGLRLMLWAGDGEHAGVSDVARLRGYDVFLCTGLDKDILKRNINNLFGSQTICLIDIYNNVQITEFCREFAGAFSHIDSDYYGNTPSLPISYYNTLLGSGGVARNIVGINSLIMPEDDMLNTVELFFPVIDGEMKKRRFWHTTVLSLAKRDEISPGEVWSSPDLKHIYYDYVREAQERFVRWQKQRNFAWPSFKDTLEEQWNSLGADILTSRLVIPIATEHLEKFSAYLTQKIAKILEEKPMFTLLQSALEESCYGRDILEVIRVKQGVIKDLMTELPSGLTGMIGRHIDERHESRPTEFGLSIIRV
jgi:hypothetical protein